jgi:hypothetical protein
MNTGEIEVVVEDILVLNKAEELPFSINAPELLVSSPLLVFPKFFIISLFVFLFFSTHNV